MTYDEFVGQQFKPRANGTWNGMRNSLITAGLPASALTIEEVNTEGVNDLRYRITAKRGNRTFEGYIELTAAGIQDGAMLIAITLYCQGNGSQITTSYTVGTPVPYNDAAGLDSLLTKLSSIETIATTELITAVRAALGL